MKKAALIFNPRAGSWQTAQRVAAIQKALAGSGYETEARPTRAPGHASELANEAAASGFEAVFAHGGDGTVRETAAGLVGTGVAMAPIPGGTTNVVARALGLPQHPLRAARALVRTEALEMDVGLCGDEVFLMQTSAGLDAHIMGRLNPWLKRRFGKAAVAYSGALHFATYDYPAIEVIADGRPLSASLMAVCNLPYYAGSYQMAPGASTSDRTLDLVLFRGTGSRDTLAFARDLLLGRHLKRDDVELIRVQRVEIRGPAGLDIQLDGDAMPVELPVTISLHPKSVRVLKPSTK